MNYGKIFLFLKKSWREVAILLLFIIAALSMRSCKNATSHLQSVQANNDALFSQGLELKLSDNTKALKIRALDGTIRQLSEQGIIDGMELAKLHEQAIKLNSLVAYYSAHVNVKQDIGVVVHDTVLTELRPMLINGGKITLAKGLVELADTLRTREKAFTYDNKWLSIAGLYNPATDTARIKYTYNVDFTLAAYKEKGKIFANINFSDPAITTTNLKVVHVTVPPTPWYDTRLAHILFGAVLGRAISR